MLSMTNKLDPVKASEVGQRRHLQRGVEVVRRAAERQVPGESLAVLRIAYGAIGLLSAWRLVSNGWVDTLFVDPSVHLRYPGMSWVPILPGSAIHLQVAVMALSSLGVLVGYRFRVSMLVFWVAFTWLEFLDATVYLNHYWFMTLVGALMLLLPMSSVWSCDARRFGPRSVPLVAVWILRFQVGLVYVFAGLAKLHGDWLTHGLPLRLWLPASAELTLVGPLLQDHRTALIASWASAAFDCAFVGFLLWRRTRLAAWLIGVCFHVVTWFLFPIIGVFPWLMIAMSTVFFDPQWPSQLAKRASRRRAPTRSPGSDAGSTPLPSNSQRWRLAALAALWVIVQIALPLRHHVYPGDHRWTGEGFRYGWNVMLVEKAADLNFVITEPLTGHTWREDGRSTFTPQQWRAMSTDPELTRQAAHIIADRESAERPGPVQVRVDVNVSLNGRPAQPLIDPTVDLADEAFRLGPQPWILPGPTTRPP